MIDEADVRYWCDEFEQRLPLLRAAEKRLCVLVEDLLHRDTVAFVSVSSRTKEPDSFAEKVQRKGYRDPLREITDLVGVRVITYHMSDVELIAALVEKSFRVDPERSPRHTPDAPELFGYASRHYVVTITEERASLPEWEQFRSVTVEIQIRTVLQHAWADMSHKLAYKNELEVPAVLRRRLARLSALCELADEQFEELHKARISLRNEYEGRVRAGHLDLPLDSAAIAAYFQEGPAAGALSEAAVRTGWLVRYAEDGETLPLLRILHALDVQTVGELDHILLLGERRLDDVLSSVHQAITHARRAALRDFVPTESVPGLALLVVTAERIGPYSEADPLVQPLLLEAAPQEEWLALEQAFTSLYDGRARWGTTS